MMTKRAYRAALLATLLTPLVGSAPLWSTERVLIVGDSWAGALWELRALDAVFRSNGQSTTASGQQTALGGTTARGWSQPEGLQTITSSLVARPSIDTVQLTIGGNDFLGEGLEGWTASLSPAQETALFDRIASDVLAVVDHVLAHRSDLRVIVSLYDYLNLQDPKVGCEGLWESLGSPEVRRVNQALADLSARVGRALAARERAVVVSHEGLMQSTFGFPQQSIAPGDIGLPGDLDRPSPAEAMADCIHLTDTGYRALADRLWRVYYRQRFASGNGDGANDPAVDMRQLTRDAAEESGRARVTVRLSAAPPQTVSVAYGTVGGSAREDLDYRSTSGTLSFTPSGPLTQVIEVELVDDAQAEGPESFFVQLSDPSPGLRLTPSRSATEIRLIDNDAVVSSCTPSETILCLVGGRFRIDVAWRTARGSGRGTRRLLSDNSGLFWFFSPENIEMLVKVLDGCQVAGLESYWVLFAATTDVEFALQVTDTATGRSRTYDNPLGRPALPVQDLNTFDSCP
ncbi:MAG: Calx-beta domain-containing protein [Acidobacteriota bacterium]